MTKKKKFDELEKWSDEELRTFINKRQYREIIPKIEEQLKIIQKIKPLTKKIESLIYTDSEYVTLSKETQLQNHVNKYETELKKDLKRAKEMAK